MIRSINRYPINPKNIETSYNEKLYIEEKCFMEFSGDHKITGKLSHQFKIGDILFYKDEFGAKDIEYIVTFFGEIFAKQGIAEHEPMFLCIKNGFKHQLYHRAYLKIMGK